jgi:hypothetical protein
VSGLGAYGIGSGFPTPLNSEFTGIIPLTGNFFL